MKQKETLLKNMEDKMKRSNVHLISYSWKGEDGQSNIGRYIAENFYSDER